MRAWGKRAAAMALGAVLAAGLTACGGEVKAGPETERDEPLVIRMYGTLDESYIPFLNALAERFPEANLKYEFQWDIPGVTEMERRILNGDGPDLAVVNGEALSSLTERELLLDLTGTELSTRYHVSAMTALNDQGRVLALPLPNDLRCLMCNLKILRENGIEQPPRTIPELIEICQTLTERGQGALMVDDQLYQMVLSTSYLCKPEGYDWLTAYNDGRAAMAGTPAEDAWRTFERLAGVSGCSVEDAGNMPAGRTSLMMEGEYAFRVVTLSNLKFMREQGVGEEVVALPLLGETEEDQWVFYAGQQNMRYFVASGALAEPENAEKKALVLRMLDWISTEEGQQILANCGSAAISYVNDVEVDQGKIMEYLNPVIETGRLTSIEVLERGVKAVVSSSAVQILGGDMTPAAAAAACDAQNVAYVPPEKKTGLDEVIGTATATIYWRKPVAVTVGSPMTQLAAQAMAEAFPEADFSFAMAKNATSTLYAGNITIGDALTCATGEGNSELVLVQAAGQQIRELIEAGVGSPTETTFVVPYGVAGKGRLLHPAGLTYRADITHETGDKITEIRLADGGTLEPDRTYTIIVSKLLVDGVTAPNLEGCEILPTGKYLYDVLVDYIRAHGEVSPPELGMEITGTPTPLYTLP